MVRTPITIHWFRRDLRLTDNHGLHHALTERGEVLPLFIFDTDILDKLANTADRRVDLIHRALDRIRKPIEEHGGALLVEHGKPLAVWERLLERYTIQAVVTNHDHEPYAIQRDAAVQQLLAARGVPFRTFKDISIFERGEVVKDDGGPYTVFTPYARKWRAQFTPDRAKAFPSERHLDRLHRTAPLPFPTLTDIGFSTTDLHVPALKLPEDLLKHYAKTRDIPGNTEGTSHMSTHLRFGTVSVRKLVRQALEESDTFLNELIWREFFMQVLWHFPHVVKKAFKPAYDNIQWINDERHFEAWCQGRTGYPLVDAGMRELEATGLMHNRVRMVTASFLCKHLLIDWRWGEAWFAEKLLDFELSSNNGNWQWASGSGCDAAPWFRVFNPTLQLEKFDPSLTYVKRWAKEYTNMNYPRPIVVHQTARARAIEAYQRGLKETSP
ncbi:MAG TPA: deoxyribodipyrimidine photo-lyase [Flavobacteriales bacterium]|jgi:deoxyribodipyrimidine photo-lyase|nr:deoxyribodipyrimidine photo-lyase [Flavobacteriales bacterium]